jgi:hypothetical protein
MDETRDVGVPAGYINVYQINSAPEVAQLQGNFAPSEL